MSKTFVNVDTANNRVQFRVKDVCSGLSFEVKDADNGGIPLNDVNVRCEILVKGKAPELLYESKFSNIDQIIRDLFNRDSAQILPLSVGKDLNLSDNVEAQFTINFPALAGAKSFEYELIRVGNRTTTPFAFVTKDISATEDIDTENFPILAFLQPEKIDNISCENSSIGYLNYTKSELDSVNKGDSYIVLAEKSQAYTIQTNASTTAFLIQY